MKKYQFFEHKECEYYPCHSLKEINCMFCYCPAYSFVQCPGNPIWLENGVKDCSSCTFPHIKSHYQQMMDYLSKQNQKI